MKNTLEQANCKNCGAPLAGEYCSKCGQKKSGHPDSFWHMLVHFVADYFHYDNKFFKTIKYLVTRPGYLTRMYMEGKRTSFLNPIQLYIFVSAVFFIVYSSNTHIEAYDKSTKFRFYVGKERPENEKETAPDFDSMEANYHLLQKDKAYYDSLYRVTKPAFNRDYLLDTYLMRKVTGYQLKKRLYTQGEFSVSVFKTFVGSLPKFFFLLLPWFALVMMIFLGRRGTMYVDHAIFSLHFHSFTFLAVIVAILSTYIPVVGDILQQTITWGAPTIYYFVAVHKFYRRHWLGSFFLGAFAGLLYCATMVLAAITNLLLVIVVNS